MQDIEDLKPIKHPNPCEHSILKCGECRAKEPQKLSTSDLEAKIAALEAKFEQLRKPSVPSNPVPSQEQVDRAFAELEQPGIFVAPPPPPPPLKLDLGCGKSKKEGFTGVDWLPFPGVDVVCDLAKDRWPWADDSVEEVHCSHFVEHLKPAERVHFVNELHRVLKKGGKATIITPHWASSRAFGDVTHQWPPISEFWFPYLNRAWRKENSPYLDADERAKMAASLPVGTALPEGPAYTCDFDCTQPGYSVHAALLTRATDYQQHALMFFKEAAADMIAVLIARK